MNYKQEIENVLFDNPQHYLMAGGGEGMEFMSTLISNHSTKYWKNESLITDKNRSHVKLPWFYTIMSNMITYDNSIPKMIDDLYNLLVEHTAYNNEQMSNRPGWHHNPEDMNSCISNVKNFYSIIDKPPLIKTHFSNSDYFTKDNTFFIYPDEYKWFEYKWHMWYIKVWNGKIKAVDFDWVFHTRKTMFLLQGKSCSAYDRLLTLVKDNKMEEMFEGHIAYLDLADPDIDLDGYLDIPMVELYRRAVLDLPEKYDKWVNSLKTMNTFNKVNVIEYSKIFQKGYLEDMFEISSDNFNDEMLKWHNKNLSVMEKFSLDTASYRM